MPSVRSKQLPKPFQMRNAVHNYKDCQFLAQFIKATPILLNVTGHTNFIINSTIYEVSIECQIEPDDAHRS
jgi:anaerobic C4-dicarboxylate transporter